ncbi:MAG TPA: hypothetical protein VFM70_03715 [Salinimicrobium sp.]|nr:hypothetical protein [Salinimicrobium sp.]
MEILDKALLLKKFIFTLKYGMKSIKILITSLIITALLTSCELGEKAGNKFDEINKRAEEELNGVSKRAEKLDSLVSEQVKRVDSLIPKTRNTIQRADSLVQKATSRIDSLNKTINAVENIFN